MPFGTFDIAGSGLHLGNMWINTISHNIANANTVRRTNEEPFRSSSPVVQEAANGQGVVVTGLQANDGQAAQVYSPGHPLADGNGAVNQPVVDLGGEMVNMIIATRSYQANLRTVESARELYQASLQIGR
ncbi:MAG: flagellar basal body rod protein FlgC [Actinomycetota bacterium]